MADIYSPKKRSEIMGRVRATGTKPELLVRKVAHRMGYRFRLHSENLPGKPDLVFSGRRKVIFVHGCFWHGHRHCPKAKRPTTNGTFWERKLSRNVERDQQNLDSLKEAGWEVLIIWECETRNHDRVAARIRRFLEGGLAEENKSLSVKVFDFFSGCGGASCGFRDAGMDIVFALDCDPDSQRTFQINFPSVHFELADIRKTQVDQIRALVEAQRPNPILFCGCAPCQPFTKQNTTRPSRDKDDRVPLLSHFARLIEGCQPDIVFVENVPGLQKLDHHTEPFGGFLQSLQTAGYHFDYKPVRLMKYGVPQSRHRLVLLASHKRHGPISLPPETNGPETENPQYETVRDWIADLPPIQAGEEHASIPNHRAARLSELNLERIQATPEGGGHGDWPRRLRLECHEKIKGYSDVYGRMFWNRPASALTTRCISYSNGRFGHPEQDRAISIREAASLQTFPRNFRFAGSMGSMARQIGNALPVRLATIVGQHVIGHLHKTGALA